MGNISFDSGIKEYTINENENVKLRVNFADPNLYHRFMIAVEEIAHMEKEYDDNSKKFGGKLDTKGFPLKDDGNIDTENLTGEQKETINNRTETILSLMYDIDKKIKRKLENIFELDNNFDKIFQGVNIMAFDGNGNRIISNFINAITPIVEQSLAITKNEIETITGNREQRRARNKHV